MFAEEAASKKLEERNKILQHGQKKDRIKVTKDNNIIRS